jgi:hypothetical protein
MMRLSVSSHQQPEVTRVVPFKNKIQYYQLKQAFLITWYVSKYSFSATTDSCGTLEKSLRAK